MPRSDLKISAETALGALQAQKKSDSGKEEDMLKQIAKLQEDLKEKENGWLW